jgi:hypothetical protein
MKNPLLSLFSLSKSPFWGALVLLLFLSLQSVSVHTEPVKAFPSPKNYEVVSVVPFHFPMEVTFAPGYQPVIPSLGTELLFAQRFQMRTTLSESPLHFFYEPSPSNTLDLRDRLGVPYLGWGGYRSPGVVFLVNRHPFSFHLDLNLRMTLDLSGQATANFLRTGMGVSYALPSTYLGSQYSAKLDLSVQAIEFQPWEEKRREKSPVALQRQFYLSPGITIGSQRGWMVEGLIRMPLPNNIQEVTDTTYKPEVQGRLGLKWYLPERLER